MQLETVSNFSYPTSSQRKAKEAKETKEAKEAKEAKAAKDADADSATDATGPTAHSSTILQNLKRGNAARLNLLSYPVLALTS